MNDLYIKKKNKLDKIIFEMGNVEINYFFSICLVYYFFFL